MFTICLKQTNEKTRMFTNSTSVLSRPKEEQQIEEGNDIQEEGENDEPREENPVVNLNTGDSHANSESEHRLVDTDSQHALALHSHTRSESDIFVGYAHGRLYAISGASSVPPVPLLPKQMQVTWDFTDLSPSVTSERHSDNLFQRIGFVSIDDDDDDDDGINSGFCDSNGHRFIEDKNKGSSHHTETNEGDSTESEEYLFGISSIMLTIGVSTITALLVGFVAMISFLWWKKNYELKMKISKPEPTPPNASENSEISESVQSNPEDESVPTNSSSSSSSSTNMSIQPPLSPRKEVVADAAEVDDDGVCVCLLLF